MSRNDEIPKPIWQPSRGRPNAMDRYREHVNSTFSQRLNTTWDLHRWSVADPQRFWVDLYGYLELVPPLPQSIKSAYDQTLPMSSNPQFFKSLNMNFAENILSNADKYPSGIALIGLREGQAFGTEERMAWRQLRERVRLTASALRRSGIRKGDRVAALVSTSTWAVVLCLASATVGAIFSSIAPDLGVEGCVARLRQISPTILFADSDSTYKGRAAPTTSKIDTILGRLGPAVPKATFMITKQIAVTHYPTIDDFLSQASPQDPLVFEQVPFNSPLLICYSSGTTGTPKCIVHQHGIVLNLKKISHLHNLLGPDDVVLQYSSTSWIMFYIMIGHLATGATTICYDGSPLWPDRRAMLKILEHYKVTYYGTSPRFLLELEIAGVCPRKEFDLSLRMINVTGASLAVSQYHYFYNNFEPHVHLCNVAGGTDIVTSLMTGDPCGPLYAGEMQIYGLGMDVDVADPVDGHSIAQSGEPGELVVRKPFPSMPAFFWGDTDGSIYRSSYFERFDAVDVWAQHDWVSMNPRTKGLVMSGRSDGVLNPSGIRFGSGEIYAITEAPPFTSSILDTLCVGRRRPQDDDETVFLFVRMLPGKAFTEDLVRQLRGAISMGLSSRHVPKFIVEVGDIPVTINGKKVEIAVKQLMSGRDIKVSSTVANPECLLGFKKFRTYEQPPRARL